MTNEQLVELIQQDIEKQENLKCLYLQNKGLIAAVAKKYTGMIEMDDLMQEGYLGLCMACERFEACKGVTFSTFAVMCIKGHLHRYVQDQALTVRLPVYRLEQIQRYEKIRNDYRLRTGKEPPERQLLLYLGIDQHQLRQLKKDAEAVKIKSLDATVSTEDDSFTLADTVADPINYIEAVDDEIQNEQCAKLLWGIVDKLKPEQSALIHEKYENNTDSKTLADKMGKTLGETRNIENKAMRELRNYRNRKKLKPFFFSDNQYYSLGMTGAGLHSFNLTWTSAQERAVIMAEEGQG